MIRRATPADAEALSTLARTCFTQTFGHLYAPADLEVFLDEAYAPDVLRAELEDPNRATWFLFEDATDEAPIGYVTACPAHLPHPYVAPGDGEAIMQRRWHDRSVAAFRILSPTRNHKRLGPVKNAEDYRLNLLALCRANRLFCACL